MAYNPNIPLATDQLKVSQSDILMNFQEINTVFGINHETFGTANQGKHKFLQLPEQVADPATAANEGALYTFQGVNSGVTELRYRRESNGTQSAFTEGLLTGNGGWSRMGSGLLLKWGTVSISSAVGLIFSRNDNFVFPVAGTIPAFTAPPFQVFLSQNGAGLGATNFYQEYDTGLTTNLNLSVNIYSLNTGGGWNAGFLSFLAIGV